MTDGTIPEVTRALLDVDPHCEAHGLALSMQSVDCCMVPAEATALRERISQAAVPVVLVLGASSDDWRQLERVSPDECIIGVSCPSGTSLALCEAATAFARSGCVDGRLLRDDVYLSVATARDLRSLAMAVAGSGVTHVCLHEDLFRSDPVGGVWSESLGDHVLQRVVVEARAGGAEPLLASSDPKSVGAASIDRYRSFGYTGLVTSDTAAASLARKQFSPTREEVAYATDIRVAFSEALRNGRAATRLHNGEMVDASSDLWAMDLLDRAAKCQAAERLILERVSPGPPATHSPVSL